MNDHTHEQNWLRAKALFIEVSELPKDEQEAFILEQTKGDPELAALLNELLFGDEISLHHEKAISKVVGEQADAILKQEASSQKGERIAEYEIEDVLGEGGMGIVYLAHRIDAQFEQSVAIKIIQSHALVPQTLERFRQERQILASLQHPNIAQLVGGGETSAGLPYIVMEYIDGVDIIKYCQTNTLSIEQRLDLFKQVLKAVSYAHQNLVIHRDIKPSNVLVTRAGVVKLLDFGIAKLIEEKALPEDKNLTAMEVKVLTYANASPEQVRKDKVTTRTDVYGLCALLYQMLTEKPLFNTNNMTSYELENWITDIDPTKPSANFSEQHSVKKADLKSTLSGDLDTIILKGLQKEPDRRYASVEQLNQDIQNYLTHYPIQAKPDSTWYKLTKFYQRNKAFTFVTSAFAVCLLGFAATMSYQAVVIDEARQVALRESSNAQQVTQFLTDTFRAANPLYSGDKQITPLDLIDSAAERISDIATDELLKAELTKTVAWVYKSIGAYDKAVDLLSDVLVQSEQIDEFPQVLRYEMQSIHLSARVDLEGAETVKDEAIKITEALTLKLDQEQDSTTKQELASIHLNNLLTLAAVYDRIGNDEDALQVNLEALDLALQQEPINDLLLGPIYAGLGHTYRSLLKLEKSLEMLEKSISIVSRSYGESNLELAYSLNQLASTYFDLDRFEEAKDAAYRGLEIRQALYPRGNAEIGASLGNLSKIYESLGEPKKSLDYRTRSVDELKRALGEEHIYYAASSLSLAQEQSKMGEHALAEQTILKVLPVFENTLTEQSIDLARPYRALGHIYYLQGSYNKTLELLDKAMSICSTAKPKGHWLTGEVHLYYALTFHALGKNKEALVNKQKAIKLYQDIFGDQSPKTDLMKKRLVNIQASSL